MQSTLAMLLQAWLNKHSQIHTHTHTYTPSRTHRHARTHSIMIYQFPMSGFCNIQWQHHVIVTNYHFKSMHSWKTTATCLTKNCYYHDVKKIKLSVINIKWYNLSPISMLFWNLQLSIYKYKLVISYYYEFITSSQHDQVWLL